MINICVILNYNDAFRTIKLVNNIINFCNIDKIIVVDNASTDNSKEEFQRLNVDKVDVVYNVSNDGYSAGNNLGARYACEKYEADCIIFANPDVVFDEELICEVNSIFERDTSVGLVSAVPKKKDGSIQNEFCWKNKSALLNVLSTSSFFYRLGFNQKYKNDELTLNIEGYSYVDCVAGSLLFFDKDTFFQMGMFDDKVFLFCEEMITDYRLRSVDKKTAIILNKTYVHEHGISAGKMFSKYKKKKILATSKLYFLKEYMHYNCIKLLFVKLFFYYVNVEQIIIGFLDSMRGGNKQV